MPNFMKLWMDDYNKCCIPLQGKGAKKLPEHLAVVRGNLGVDAALKKVDANDPFSKNAGKERDAIHKVLEKEVKGYEAEAAKYKKLIDAALKVTAKTEKDAYRALKKLAAHLDLITAQIVHHMTTYSKESTKATAKADARVEKETKAAQKKGLSDDDVKKEVDYAKQLKSLSQFPTAVVTAYAKAKVTVQNIKSDPTPATYNKEMEAGGRNYTQQLGNLIKLSKDSKCPPDLKVILKGIDAYKGAVDAYGNGPRRKIADDTSEKNVLDFLKGFARLVKESYPFATEMKEYLKNHKLK